ncbi:unnamed protein product [Lymnaea stagnalis]|uniref:G-protein coupled receptors family 1 profile domain-containing protein n=1 Tax=Lymnaea stagnalis TaxID=6523 RepID=A0AAV2I9G7_LYMST
MLDTIDTFKMSTTSDVLNGRGVVQASDNLTAGDAGNAATNSTTSLTDMNDAKAETLISAMVLLGILMIVGIVGNSLVVYVFCFKMKTGTQNILIVLLAVFDLLSCCLSIPNEIADMRYFFMFGSEEACKIMRFINTFCAIGSILTLLVIAVDRFRKICRPFKSQMRNKHVKLSLIPILGGAVFFSWPAFALYGLRTTETDVPGLDGYDCSTPNGIGETIIPLLYNLVLFACFIIITCALGALYFCILRETNRHNRYMKRNSDFNLSSSGQYNDDSGSSVDLTPVANQHSASSSIAAAPALVVYNSAVFDYSSELIFPQPTTDGDQSPTGDCSNTADISRKASTVDSDVEKVTQNAETAPHQGSDIISTEVSNRVSNGEITSGEKTTRDVPITVTVGRKPSILITGKSGYVRKDLKIAIVEPIESFRVPPSTKHKRHRIKSKTTIIAFLVTLVFVLSFLPHLSLQVAKMINKGFDYHLRGAALVAYNIFLRSYFINSVSNPFIYGALNLKFKGEVKKLLLRICHKK